MICADTSFLISLYGTDVHTPAAKQRFTDAGQPLVIHTIAEEYVLDRAASLSEKHTLTGGHRSYDLLIVAAALEAGATEFWGFDARQRELATAEGLLVGP